MQEINLLQNKVKDRTLQFEKSNRILVVVCVIIMILEGAAFGGLYFLTNSTKTVTAKIQQENADIQTSMNSNQDSLNAAKGLQAQLKNVKTLLNNHVYWSEFLNQVSAVVPNKIQFVNLSSSSSDDKLHVEGIAQSYDDIGRLLLSLNGSDKFSNATLHSITPSTGTTFGYMFTIDVAVSPSVFKK